MINNILKLEGVKALNKQQLKNINGGSGTCQYYSGRWGVRYPGLSPQEAEGRLTHNCDHWCCTNCDTASWRNAPTVADINAKTASLETDADCYS